MKEQLEFSLKSGQTNYLQPNEKAVYESIYQYK